MKEKIAIGFVSHFNPFTDRRAWSGTIFKIREAIENAGFEVNWIPYHSKTPLLSCYEWILKLRQRITGRRTFRSVHNPTMVRLYAETIDMSLVNQCDYLFFPGGAQISLFLKTKKPVIYLADATVHQMIGYYWNGFSNSSIRKAKLLEERAVKNSCINIRSSLWAQKSTVDDCGADAKKCFVLEFGANLDMAAVKTATPYSGGELRLLFSGIDWYRKGGNTAIETVSQLREKGINATLTVVGPKRIPTEYKGHDFIHYLGFLDKNKPEEYAAYLKVWEDSHALLLPTRAECSAIVFSEAAVFGIPCYTTSTGGVPNYVINDKNGYAFSVNSTPSEIADKIEHDIRNHMFEQYHNNALKLSREKLSWEAWAERFRKIMCCSCFINE